MDIDPIVLVHGQALLTKTSGTAVVAGDVRRPEQILDNPRVREYIDLDQPLGLLFFAILHHLNDDEDPAGVAARYLDALAPGSHVAISHFHNPGPSMPEVAEQTATAEKLFNEHLGTGRWRTREEILSFFGDLELVDPGLVPVAEWRPEPGEHSEQGITYHTFVGGVGRKR
ncbi:SAM-dependent methyltransferase [Thermocatellispora tengchongensis]|uniref:SAM-dependent methyltransferase n=1 Tax=Thermocatellispora tengchongensis TaxID=1073253 RepID=UPI003634DC07